MLSKNSFEMKRLRDYVSLWITNIRLLLLRLATIRVEAKWLTCRSLQVEWLTCKNLQVFGRKAWRAMHRLLSFCRKFGSSRPFLTLFPISFDLFFGLFPRFFRSVLTFFRLLKLGLRLAKSWPGLTSLKCVMIIALNQYWYLDLELDLPGTDIDLALSTGLQVNRPRPG